MVDEDQERTAEELQEQVFDLLERSHLAMLGAGRAVRDSVSNVVPADLSAVDDVIDRVFDFTEQVLRTQREFAKNVVDEVMRQLEAERAGREAGEGGPDKEADGD